jgi:ribosomal protein S18 acetylase RimI-like enzyme
VSPTPSNMFFRRAGKSDAAAIRKITRDVYAKWIPLIGREPMPMQADYDKAVLEHWIDLAEVDGSLVGLIEMIPCDDHLFIENLAVVESMQGQGLASELLRHAEKIALQYGLAEVQLATNQSFTENLIFYQKRGYEAYETKAFHLGGIGVRFRKPVS